MKYFDNSIALNLAYLLLFLNLISWGLILLRIKTTKMSNSNIWPNLPKIKIIRWWCYSSTLSAWPFSVNEWDKWLGKNIETMPGDKSLFRNIARCCFLRIKRALPFGFFISLSLMIIVIIFYAMNQNHTQLNVIKERLKGGHGLGPESYNMMKLEKEPKKLLQLYLLKQKK